MPITGYTLYPFRWHYRRDTNITIQTTTGTNVLVTRVPPMPIVGNVPVGSQPLSSHSVAASELQPSLPGSYYGEKSPQGAWSWNGTGRVDDAWVVTLKDA